MGIDNNKDNKIKTIDIEKEGLNSVLETAGLIIRKSPIPLFSNILFSKRGIIAINEFCTLIHDIEIDTPFDFGVSSEIFKITKNKTELEFQISKNYLSIKSEDSKAKLNYITDIDIEFVPNVPSKDILQKELTPLPLNFMEGLKKVKVYSEGDNSLIPENYCFLIKNNSVYCTNNKVIIKFDFDDNISSMTFPVSAYPILAAFEPEEYFISDSSIYFKTGKTFLCLKNIERTQRTDMIVEMVDKYKDVSDDKKIYLIDDFNKAILEASVFISKDDFHDGLVFHKEEDILEIQSKNSKGQIKKECLFPDGTKVEDFEDFILSYKFLKYISGAFDFFIVEDVFVVFFDNNTTTIICKITE